MAHKHVSIVQGQHCYDYHRIRIKEREGHICVHACVFV